MAVVMVDESLQHVCMFLHQCCAFSKKKTVKIWNNDGLKFNSFRTSHGPNQKSKGKQWTTHCTNKKSTWQKFLLFILLGKSLCWELVKEKSGLCQNGLGSMTKQETEQQREIPEWIQSHWMTECMWWRPEISLLIGSTTGHSDFHCTGHIKI